MGREIADKKELNSGGGAAAGGETADQGATSHTIVRNLVRTTAGFVALGADGISAFVRTSVERGQQMEVSAHKLVGRYQDNAKTQAKAAEASRSDLMKQTWVTLNEHLKALSRMLTLPDDKQQAAEQPSDTSKPVVQGEQDNGDSSTA